MRLGRIPSWRARRFRPGACLGRVVVYAIWVVLMSLAFWFVSVENIAVLFDAVYEGARYPSRRTRSVAVRVRVPDPDRVDHDHPGVGAHGRLRPESRSRPLWSRLWRSSGARVVARGDQAVRRHERLTDRPTDPSTPPTRSRWDRRSGTGGRLGTSTSSGRSSARLLDLRFHRFELDRVDHHQRIGGRTARPS